MITQRNELEYVREMLVTSNKAAVAKAVGLSARTVRDVASGKQERPAYDTIRRLAEHFRGK